MKRNVIASSSSGSARVVIGSSSRRLPDVRPSAQPTIGRACSAVRAYQSAASSTIASSTAGPALISSENHASPTPAATATSDDHRPAAAGCGRAAARRVRRPARPARSRAARAGGTTPRPPPAARRARAVISQQLAGAVDVGRHLLDERLDRVEGDHPAQPLDEADLDLDAVQLQVGAVEHVALDPAVAHAVEGRVGADADRGRVDLAGVEPAQPAGVDAVGRRGGHRVGRHVGGREAQAAAALVALHDHAAHGVRPAERLGGAGDVAGGQAHPDVRRGPHLRAAVERDALGGEAEPGPRLAQRRDVAGGAVAEAEVGADDDRGGVQRRRRAPARRTPPATSPRRRGRRARASTWSAPTEPSSSARTSSEVSVVGACSGRSTAIGCGSKVTATTGSDALVGDLPGPGQHVPVPEVHPVEVPDHHGGRAEVGRDLVEGAPDLHGEKTIRGQPVKTATGRAVPSRGS